MIPSTVDKPVNDFFLKQIEMLKRLRILWWLLHIEKCTWRGNKGCKKDTRGGDQTKSLKPKKRYDSDFTKKNVDTDALNSRLVRGIFSWIGKGMGLAAHPLFP